MLIKLAWRNLWRQKRRTILTASALALALVLSLLTRSFQEGSYNTNIDNTARFYTGLIQLQATGYADNPSIDDLLSGDIHQMNQLTAMPSIELVLPRLESVALAAAGDRSKGVIVLGVDPVLENRYSGISNKVSQGQYLISEDDPLTISSTLNAIRHPGVLIGEGLAHYLRLGIGDEIVLYGQGYQGQTAAGLYTVNGLLKFSVASLDNQLVYMPIGQAQALYSTGNQVTSWVLHTHRLNDVDEVKASLSSYLGEKIRVRDWKELSPELAQQIALDRAGGIFLIYLLYGIVGFGLFATIMMTTLERQREFGVMLAAGMSRARLVGLLFVESAFICVLGISIGITIAIPMLSYFYFHPIEITGQAAQVMLESGFEPILPVHLDPDLFVNQAIAVAVILLVCLIGPTWRILRMNLVSALKGGTHGH
ncbi:ABC transporter substrate-binding protein [Vibrio sp. 10N.286.49.C2]|uniref:ABC transporter permease n=1 Tax=unclassified Vibrio TaxID=2614977 RepID=UPI000C82E5B3|nr:MULTISPECIES: FtsX-like permease family protein [unclassified Vibrio]PMH34876.1 ABC transporter substrate-binding protein [Vibrio sp. 10N.286.49.C2]PMH51336.1 ABC transporter substrate-binding protein [Vibrio sp. 10N.286.49.B1]PMH83717.1 ABC transporter substrate-binding protein [Vibrio sp. 10N.286.48.B7]